jgi:hypothetical protein
MAIIAKLSGNGGSFEPTPTGPQHAVCAFVEDIGTHEDTYQGRPIQRRQIVICWELSETMTIGENAGKPFMISKFYTLSLNEKANLRHDLEAWRGKAFTEEELAGFDVERLIGVNCMLNVVEKKKQDGNITQTIGSIMPAIKGLPKITPVNEVPPAWIAKKREDSIEWRERNNGFGDQDSSAQPYAQPNGELPF